MSNSFLVFSSALPSIFSLSLEGYLQKHIKLITVTFLAGYSLACRKVERLVVCFGEELLSEIDLPCCSMPVLDS